MEKITSRQNELIKRYRRLRDSRQERYADRLFVVEGYKLCGEAAQSGLGLALLLYVDQPRRSDALRALCAVAETACEIAPALAEYLSDTDSPQGVFALCRMPQPQAFAPQTGKRYLLLDRLQDPGNVGTILRTAEAMGIDGVALSEDCADLWSPKTLRSAMGSSLRLPLFPCALAEAVEKLKVVGIPCCAAALTKEAVDIRTLSFEKGGALIIGNEGAGVSPALIAQCGRCAVIPMAGGAESLNAAAAAAVVLWELSGKYLPKAGESR